MNILTDEDIADIWETMFVRNEKSDIDFARAIEAAVMAKFEVVAHVERQLGGGLSDVISDFLPPGTPLYALKEKK